MNRREKIEAYIREMVLHPESVDCAIEDIPFRLGKTGAENHCHTCVFQAVSGRYSPCQECAAGDAEAWVSPQDVRFEDDPEPEFAPVFPDLPEEPAVLNWDPEVVL